MSDDIVTRLRTDFECYDHAREAADEIEDLRAELEEFKRQYALLKAELKRWQTCEMVTESICGWDSEKTYCDACKAVRGE